MRKFYTAEAVTEGHPDKLCDQIADAILDVCLKQDEQSRVACEVLATKGTIIVAGEITSTYEPDVFAVVRKVLSDVGYSSEGIAMDTFVHRQSPDIAGAVDTSKERREGVSDNQIDWFQGAGDWQDVCLSGSLCVDAEIFHTNGTKQPAKTASGGSIHFQHCLAKSDLVRICSVFIKSFGRTGHYSDTTSGSGTERKRTFCL